MLALVISAIVGLTIVAFVAVTERLGILLVNAAAWQRFASPAAGSLIGGYLLYRFFPEARGSGIPQTRVALILQRGVIRFRTVVGKFLCSALSLGSGVALGREGPSVHIGAGIASVVGRKLGLREETVRSLIPVGTAAAVAAAFNTPLAAVLFTLEEILADLHARVVGTVVLGAATSWIVLRLILGDEPLFHVPPYQLVHPLEFAIYAVLGVFGGLVSTAFVKSLLWIRIAFNKLPVRWKPVTPAFGGACVGLLAVAVPGVLGVGYDLVGKALNSQLTLSAMAVLLALKLMATATSYSSGNAGGIFGPSLFIGAMAGGTVGYAAHQLLPDQTASAGAYALVGMGAAFAGIIRTPMTSVIMIFELTRDYTIIVPLMIANLCSYFIAQRFQKVPIYEALSLQDGVVVPSAAHEIAPLTVAKAMRPEARPGDELTIALDTFVYPDEPLDTAMQRMGQAGRSEIDVLSRVGGRRIAALSFDDAVRAYRRESRADPPAMAPTKAERNWLAAAGVITVSAILIVAGLVYWQRARRAERGAIAYQEAVRLLSAGRADEAVMAYRTAVANERTNRKYREGLGLALVQTGHWQEARTILDPMAKSDPGSGLTLWGLAQAAALSGDRQQAARLSARALSLDWPDEDQAVRRRAEFEYAQLLIQLNRPSEALAGLTALIERVGDDPHLGKRAANLIRANGTPQQAEAAYSKLAARYPFDAEIWRTLGDVREAAGNDAGALEAYRKAATADPGDAELTRLADVLENAQAIDPTRRNLSIRARAQRWNAILERVAAAAQPCSSPAELAEARTLLKRNTTSLTVLDRKQAAAIALWHRLPPGCRSDQVLSHVLAKVRE